MGQRRKDNTEGGIPAAVDPKTFLSSASIEAVFAANFAARSLDLAAGAVDVEADADDSDGTAAL